MLKSISMISKFLLYSILIILLIGETSCAGWVHPAIWYDEK